MNSTDKMLQFIGKNIDEHNRQETRLRLIADLFEVGFEVRDPKGTIKVTSKTLQSLIWRAKGKMKPLDFMIHGSGAEEETEKLVTDGVRTVMDEGQYLSCMRDKGGVFHQIPLFGDSFTQIGFNFEKGKYPIQFRMCSLSDVIVDSHCTDIRSPASGNSCSEIVLIYRYSPEMFRMVYPGVKATGPIPRSKIDGQLDKTAVQTTKNQDEVEVAHYFNLGDPSYTVFAGAEMKIISESKGKKYPYILDDVPYIPVLHWKFFDSYKGFYNHGLGDMLYDLIKLASACDNMAFGHATDNIYPINIINLPKAQASEFFQKYISAQDQRAAGGKGWIVNELSVNDPTTAINLASLQSAPITNEWERIINRMDQYITRLGFQLDAVDRGTSVTATQIIAEEENSDATIKQVMEDNASETKMAVKITMDMISKLSKKDNTPLNITTMIETEEGEARMDYVTMGMVADELKSRRWFVVINNRSGTYPSNVMRQAQISRMLQYTAPGTPAYNKLVYQLAQINDRDLKMGDFSAPAPQMPEGTEENAMPSETDELMAKIGNQSLNKPEPII